MPFTFSHPAAVLPFTYLPKRWISVTELVIGSLSPDFEYFLRMKVYSVYSHTWTGLFWFDLPLTIILSFVFHLIVRNTLIDSLPSFLQKRFVIFKCFEWIENFKSNFLIVIASIIVGIATHILWDGFTHEKGQFVELFGMLRKTIAFGKNNIPIYKLLQHLSTAVGGLIIIYALFRLPKYKILIKQKSILPFWFSVGLITLIITIVKLIIISDYKSFGNIMITIITSGLIGLFLTTSFLSRKQNKNPQHCTLQHPKI